MNQITSLYDPMGGAANAVLGLHPEIYPPDPYRLDDPGLVPEGWVMNIEGNTHSRRDYVHIYAGHELMKKRYPDMPNAEGIPYTGLSNARPETLAIGERVRAAVEAMPFDVREYLAFENPGSDDVGDWGQ